MRRAAHVFVVVAAGVWLGAGAWLGCSPSSPDADPGKGAGVGSSFGAEVSVVIAGPGRVTSMDGVIDCPGRCLGRWVPSAVDGSSGVPPVSLGAMAAAGASFVGFTFDEEQVATRGSGPDRCSPIVRRGSTVGVDEGAQGVRLPLGAVAGDLPAGMEQECDGHRSVPLAYRVTATFASDAKVVVDTETEDVLTMAGDEKVTHLGIVEGILYARISASARDGGLAKRIATNEAPHVTESPPGTRVRHARTEAYFVVQHVDRSLRVFERGDVTSSREVGSATTNPLCDELASNRTHVFCRERLEDAGLQRIHAWRLSDQEHRILAETSAGDTLASSDDAVFFSPRAGGPIERVAIAPPASDGGMPPPVEVTPVRKRVSTLDHRHGWLFWLEAGTAYGLTGNAARPIPLPDQARMMVADPVSAGVMWVVAEGTDWNGGPWTIYRLSNDAPSSPLAFVHLTQQVQALVSDGKYIYWTVGDNRVVRKRVLLGGP